LVGTRRKTTAPDPMCVPAHPAPAPRGAAPRGRGRPTRILALGAVTGRPRPRCDRCMLIEYAVRLDAVTRAYGTGEGRVVALDAVSAGFPAGSFTAVMGPSGSGKSTLLHCA